ncbi:MAG: ATP-binding protein [Bacteriovoracaceae bacterium]
MPLKNSTKTELVDVLSFISRLEQGDFSKSLSASEDSILGPIIDQLNKFSKVLASQTAQETAFIVESLGIGIWKWDLITNKLEWDKNMYQLYGADPNDFTGAYDAWESSLSAETKAKAVEEINIAVAGGKSFDTTFQVVHKKTGHVQEIRTRAFLIRDASGKPNKMWGINIDRTREAELELEVLSTLSSLESASKLLERTGEMAKVGGWELNLKTGQVNMTRQTQILHEIDSNYVPLLFSTGAEWYPPEAWPKVQDAVKAAIEQGKPYDLKSPFITAKGRNIWVRVQGFPIMKEGVVSLLRGTFQDITEEIQAEEKIKEMSNQLIQSSKLASLGEMAAGVAHEINNPLAIIEGTANQIPKYLQDPEKFNAKMEIIKKACGRISRIVGGLKKFSRSDSKIEFSSYSLSSIAKEALILTETKSKRHSVPVTIKLSSDTKVLCNEIEIEQVIVNLINNAIDAVKDNVDKWVELSIFDDHESLVLRVMDSGKGVTEDVRSRIFQPFFTTKQVGEGTGLGLSISKGILDEHGATIKLLSDCPNTCFEVRFPNTGEMKNAT